MKKDVVSKEIIKTIAQDISKYILNILDTLEALVLSILCDFKGYEK